MSSLKTEVSDEFNLLTEWSYVKYITLFIKEGDVGKQQFKYEDVLNVQSYIDFLIHLELP